MEHIVSLSGGKDSTAMLLKMIEKDIKIDEIIYVDTTKEFPVMYKHLNKLQDYIEMEITKLSFDFDYWFKDHVKTKGKNKGKKGYGWPEPGIRWCTAKKRDLIKSYLSGKNYIIYQGIAYDERVRALKNVNKGEIRYPLIDWKITERQALKYCVEILSQKGEYKWIMKIIST